MQKHCRQMDTVHVIIGVVELKWHYFLENVLPMLQKPTQIRGNLRVREIFVSIQKTNFRNEKSSIHIVRFVVCVGGLSSGGKLLHGIE